MSGAQGSRSGGTGDPGAAEDRRTEGAEDRPAETAEDGPAQAAEDGPAQAAEDRPTETAEDRPTETAEDRPAQTAEDRPAQAPDEPAGVESDDPPPESAPRGRRGHRRVTSPPTNVGADRSDDSVRGRGTPPAADHDPRDAWIREQRPPHWD